DTAAAANPDWPKLQLPCHRAFLQAEGICSPLVCTRSCLHPRTSRVKATSMAPDDTQPGASEVRAEESTTTADQGVEHPRAARIRVMSMVRSAACAAVSFLPACACTSTISAFRSPHAAFVCASASAVTAASSLATRLSLTPSCTPGNPLISAIKSPACSAGLSTWTVKLQLAAWLAKSVTVH